MPRTAHLGQIDRYKAVLEDLKPMREGSAVTSVAGQDSRAADPKRWTDEGTKTSAASDNIELSSIQRINMEHVVDGLGIKIKRRRMGQEG